MGCSSAKEKADYKSVKLDFSLSQQEDAATQDKKIPEFPYTNDTLRTIDYKSIIAGGKEWIDPFFKPDINAIFDKGMVRPERIKNWETFVWKRPKEVYGKGKFKVFADIGPNDIKQGLCGDCYFLSAISSLAEIQKRVTDIFITEEVNDAGCYSMYFYINGEVKEVVVDDYFPYDNHKQTWAFSRSNKDNEIWVLLLEKAWAKICGSYQRIEAGTVGEALPYLCGAPSKFFYHEEMKSQKEELWKMIKEGDSKNYIMGTAVSSKKSLKNTQDMQKIGLVDAHAYSLIAVYEELFQGKPLRLIKIRNPWGFKEWQGDWSDKSTLWTPELKTKLSLENKDDGVFFISFDDYFNFFYITTICYWVEGNDTSELPDTHSNGQYSVITFENTKEYNSTIIFTANQIGARFADETMNQTYAYAPLKFILAKITSKTNAQGKEDKELIFINGEYMQFQHAMIEVPKLTLGSYVIFLKAEWDPLNLIRRLVYNIYAPDPFQIKRASMKQYPNQIFEMMETWLNERLSVGFKYVLPVYSSIADESDELLKSVTGFSLKIQTAQQGEKIFYKYEEFNMDQREEAHLCQKEICLDLVASQEVSKSHQLEKNFYGINIDVIRKPFHQTKKVAKPTTKESKKVKPQISSGISLAFEQDDKGHISIDLKANNQRDVFCIDNKNCPTMVIDLEISCSSLRQNINFKNLTISQGEKKLKEFIGFIDPETNSCFKYHIRPAVLYKNEVLEEEKVDQEKEEEKDPELIQQVELDSNEGDREQPLELEENQIPNLDEQRKIEGQADAQYAEFQKAQ